MARPSGREAPPARLDVLVQASSSSIDWANPSRTEVAVTGAFISGQGGEIHHGLGGSSQLDVDRRKYEIFRPYLQLEQALKFYIPNVLDIKGTYTTWDDLSDKISKMEKQYGNTKMGLFHSLWHKMGRHQETADAWIAFIPDEYGLSVVRAGLALVFRLAESSVEKRKMIFDTYAALRDCLIQAHPERGSFRANQKVNECVDRLYQTVVDSIQDMAVLLVSEKSTWNKFTSKFKRHKDAPLPSAEEILQNLEQRTKEFRDALQVARDRALEGTEMMTRATGIRAVMIHEDVLATKDHAEHNRKAAEINAIEVGSIKTSVERGAQELSYVNTGLDRNTKEVAHIRTSVDKYTTAVEKAGVELKSHLIHLSVDMDVMNQRMEEEAAHRHEEHDERGQQHQELYNLILSKFGDLEKITTSRNKISRREMALQESQSESRTLLMNLLLDRQSMATRISVLEGQVQNTPKAVVSLVRFCDILARPVSARYANETPPDLARMFDHPVKDLGQALAEQETCSISSQGQVQSLLRHNQFIHWLNSLHPSLLLVDANIESAALNNLSVISVFCATFVSNLMELQPDDFVAHFFCGLHATPSNPWYGPRGLVRSLIVQLVMKLVAMDRDMMSWNIDFINDREHLSELEHHDLHSLCVTLHKLLHQFPADMSITCIVDSISCFDVDRLFYDFELVTECFKAIVEDTSMAAIIKIFLTNPGSSTLRVKRLSIFMEDSSRLVSLSDHDFDPSEITGRGVGRHLQRAYSPLPRSPSPLPPRSHHSPLPRRSLSPLPPRPHPRQSPQARPQRPPQPQPQPQPRRPPQSRSPQPAFDKYGQTRVGVREVEYDDEGRYYEDRW